MKSYKKKIVSILILLAIGLCLIGRWLMRVYGLDPPYIYFNAGFIMVGLSLFILVTLVVFALIQACRTLRK